MNLKSQLEYYLKKHDMSIFRLATKTGLSRQTIAHWFKEKMPRNIENLKRTAEVFGVTIDNLLFGNGEEKSP
jgi:transcriptional regulator with XRE-family HTH domain